LQTLNRSLRFARLFCQALAVAGVFQHAALQIYQDLHAFLVSASRGSFRQARNQHKDLFIYLAVVLRNQFRQPFRRGSRQLRDKSQFLLLGFHHLRGDPVGFQDSFE